jgi:hypothetical protein
MEVRDFRRIAVWGLLFAGAGAALGFAAFFSGLADSGYALPSLRTTILGSLAIWPDYVCGRESLVVNLGACNSLRSLGDKAPLPYLFGIPIVGWGLIRVFIGFMRSRPRPMSPHARGPTKMMPH